MANTIAVQNKIAKQVAFAWEAAEGLGDKITWKNNLIDPADATGQTVSLRRPSRVQATVTTMDSPGATDLPGVTQPAVGYQATIDASFPVTVTTKIEVNIQASIQELLASIDKGDIQDRYLEPAIVSFKDQANYELAKFAALAAGQTINTTSYSTYAQNFLASLGSAKALMQQRGGMTPSQEKLLVAHMDVMPQLGPSAATLFNYGSGIQGAQAGGKIVQELAGFRLYESPLLYETVQPAAAAGVTVAAPSGNVTNGIATGYAQTMQVNLAGLPNSTTYTKGTRWAFNGVFWNVPTTGASTNKQATFVQTADFTSSGTGTATITLAEALCYGGSFRNTNLATALPTGTGVSIILPGAAFKPSFAMTRDAIIGVSPLVKLPDGVPFAKNFKTPGGFNFAMVSDHWPGTLQTITKLIGFVGFGAAKPEAICTIV
jgi:hypothetical protein